ncbi:MAG TPA: helix-turn-helix transcriptional regulator [Candidatus Krumholzibacteria bacterium]|nr:helix-turn-helix transcriptional regulator [Candidatus Krumholzibacteria bacterium]HPD73549.1 helix-turn-helix transcriptional regulator [Candidatus Krumholzibacteria bacterium]
MTNETTIQMPPRWRKDTKTDENYAVFGEFNFIHGTAFDDEDNSRCCWQVSQGETLIASGDEPTTWLAAHAAEQAIADWILHASPQEVISLLRGTQETVAARGGWSQSTVSEWRSGTRGTGMDRASRHLILALLGGQWEPGELVAGRPIGWRFR